MNRIFASLILVCAGVLFAPHSAQAIITIDMVPIGNPGNAPDTEIMTDGTTGFGSVGYGYRMGKYEVTAGQYTEFLNAVADADPNGLYNMDMAVLSGANIQRTGFSPNYSYSVAADWADRPVNYVSFWDAARFANWLHNGQPNGPQGPDTTEHGAYHDVGDRTLFGRNAGARFFIPTEDEWYKAAYHDKTAGLAANYFDYPTGTNAVPGRDMTEATNPGNNANYYLLSGHLIGSPYYRTVAGEFELSDSPYGTFDQGGNVLEWNETTVIVSCCGLRGGAYDFGDFSRFLLASYHSAVDPPFDSSNVGFRVASIPEPASITLCLAGMLMLTLRRRMLLPPVSPSTVRAMVALCIWATTLAASPTAAQQSDSATINGTFIMLPTWGDVGPDLAEIVARGETHTWTLTLHGLSYSNDYEVIEPNDFYTISITRVYATSFDFQFQGPDADALNAIVSDRLVNGGLQDGPFVELRNVTYYSHDWGGLEQARDWVISITPIDYQQGFRFLALPNQLEYPWYAVDANGYPVLEPFTSSDARAFITGYGGTIGTQSGNTVSVVSVVPPLPGDYNQNGKVDAADYVLWRKNNNTSITLPNDATAGTDPTDYAVWRTYFGPMNPSGSGSALSGVAVPEPTTIVLLALATKRWHLRRRRAA